MGQLFQPTNITPDTRGSFGNGVVTIDTGASIWVDYITVSWQVNGNVPMTAFKIDFTEMDGTALYSTGKLTDGCPFYGVSADGSINRFSYRIGPMDESDSFLREASEGLLRITQWWGDGANDYVTQYSPSPYLVRTGLSTWFEPGGDHYTLTGRSGTFTGQFEGDESGLLWIRWVLTRAGQTIKDTGRLYGCVDPTFTYDMFLPGTYTLELTAETSDGVISAPGLGKRTIHVEYSMLGSGLMVEASRACDGESAVLVRWTNPYNIPRTSVSGFCSDSGNGSIYLFSGCSMTWNQVNGNTMDFSTPWSFVWSGEITASSDGDLFSLGLIADRRIDFGFSWDADSENKYIYYKLMDGVTETYIKRIYTDYTDGPFFVCITPKDVFIQHGTPISGLFPEDTLYPDNALFPDAGEQRTDIQRFPSLLDSADPDYKQTILKYVTLYGYSVVKFAKVLDHIVYPEGEIDTTSPYAIRDFITNYVGSYPDMEFDAGTLFLLKSKADQTWNAGNVSYDSDMTGIVLYRKKSGSASLSLVGKLSEIGTSSILDYGARSQQGPYSYYLYPLTATEVESAPAVSNETNPCFWNWTVLACTKQNDGTYQVEMSFLFGMNLSSGAVSNKNEPNILRNFSRYPTVQMASQNYRAGTLQSLIGYVDHTDGQERYADSVSLRDSIYELSTYTGFMFLKDRKGSLYMIRPAGDITMDTMDNTREQAQTVSFPWVEVGDASEASIIREVG